MNTPQSQQNSVSLTFFRSEVRIDFFQGSPEASLINKWQQCNTYENQIIPFQQVGKNSHCFEAT